MINNRSLSKKKDIKLSEVKTSHVLAIDDVTREHSATYVLEASNMCATKTVEIPVTILDTPGQPEGPIEFSDINLERVTLDWKDPLSNGGSKISDINLER